MAKRVDTELVTLTRRFLSDEASRAEYLESLWAKDDECLHRSCEALMMVCSRFMEELNEIETQYNPRNPLEVYENIRWNATEDWKNLDEQIREVWGKTVEIVNLLK